MVDSKAELRSKYKALYRECLWKLTATEDFIEYWKSLGLYQTGYHFEQIQAKHRKDAVNILSYQFSCSGSTTTNQVFMISAACKQKVFEATFNWAVETGLGMVVLNKYNKVCAVSIGHDICDPNPNPYKPNDKGFAHLMELINSHRNNDVMWHKTIGTKKEKHEWKMGEVWYGNVGAVAPHLAHKGILRTSLERTIAGMMGYKFYYASMANSITIKWAQRMSKLPFIYGSKPFDFSNFVFNDGVKMEDYYIALTHQYGFRREYVDRLKDNSKLAVYFCDWSNIADKSFNGWISVWKQCVNVINNYSVSKL